MLHKEREQEILNILEMSNGYVSVKYLCEALYASESSIRRDLTALENQGLIKRSYGGATLITSHARIGAFSHRAKLNMEAKRAIAKKAATLINDGDIIFLDQSSTCLFLANELLNRSSLTVVTNNTEILVLLSDTKINVISSGGFLHDGNRICLLGGDAQRTFENMYADTAFFSTKNVTCDGIISDFSREEILVRDCMIRNAEKKVFLCDSSKYGGRAPYKQCDLKDIDILISEGDAATAFADYSPRLTVL